MAFVDWSSLPADLINHIAECFLATSDLDYYMDFRAVCHVWRSATEDPGNSPHPRFRPHQWVIINQPCGSNSSHLFVNTTTGRFLRKELLPLLQNYFIITATSDGLLALMGRNNPQVASVLNPFTGYLIRFIAPAPDGTVDSAAFVSGPSPTLILLCAMYYNYDHDLEMRVLSPEIYMADPESEYFTMYEEKDACPLIRLAVRGIYTNGVLRSVAPFPIAMAKQICNLIRFFNADAAETSDEEDAMLSDEKAMWNSWIGYENSCFLVESAGEKLIIIEHQKGMEVYRIDTERHTVKDVDNIGNRAIFLGGFCRSMSVNVDKFPSLEANCIYYRKSLHISDDIYMYNVMDQREERIEERICEEISYGSRPYTIIQHLCHSLERL